MLTVQQAEKYLDEFTTAYATTVFDRNKLRRMLERRGYMCGEWMLSLNFRASASTTCQMRVYWEGSFLGILKLTDSSSLTFSFAEERDTLS